MIGALTGGAEAGAVAAAQTWIPMQSGPNVDVTIGNPLFGVVGSAVGAFLTTLLVGAILVALAPEYVER